MVLCLLSWLSLFLPLLQILAIVADGWQCMRGQWFYYAEEQVAPTRSQVSVETQTAPQATAVATQTEPNDRGSSTSPQEEEPTTDEEQEMQQLLSEQQHPEQDVEAAKEEASRWRQRVDREKGIESYAPAARRQWEEKQLLGSMQADMAVIAEAQQRDPVLARVLRSATISAQATVCTMM